MWWDVIVLRGCSMPWQPGAAAMQQVLSAHTAVCWHGPRAAVIRFPAFVAVLLQYCVVVMALLYLS